MRRAVLLIAPWVILAAAAEARMYQWTSPASGRVQLAGSPPGWYRGPDAGPRVLVFENGELVDDTAIAVVLDACTDLKPGDEVIPWPNLASPILERVPPVDRCQEPSGLAQGYVVDGGADQPTVYGSGHVRE